MIRLRLIRFTVIVPLSRVPSFLTWVATALIGRLTSLLVGVVSVFEVLTCVFSVRMFSPPTAILAGRTGDGLDEVLLLLVLLSFTLRVLLLRVLVLVRALGVVLGVVLLVALLAVLSVGVPVLLLVMALLLVLLDVPSAVGLNRLVTIWISLAMLTLSDVGLCGSRFPGLSTF